jgi:DNA-binding XRE family transcriptional regulator
MIHKALRLIRQYHQKTQSELAVELSITKEQLVSIESGCFPVSSKLLQGYSEIFDIQVSSLIFFSESIGKEGKYSKRIRNSLAGKALDVLEWMTERNEKRKIQA